MPRTDAFEKHTGAYDNWFEQHADLYRAELKAVRGVMPPPPAEGMEVGVGTGKFAVPLGIKIGVEPSEKMAARARKQGIEVYPGIAEALPFEDERFDVVLLVTTICFVDDILQTFKEAFRVLKPDGCAVVGFVDSESELGREYARNKEKSKFYSEATFFSAREVETYLKKADFHIETIRQTLIPGEEQLTVLDGAGNGAFIVIKGIKRAD
jgi:ubiquinone/menaquinone biosynthesis C-methylase UbiE